MRAFSVLVLGATLAGCGGAQKPGGLPASARGILGHVGADTPYLFAMLSPPPPAYRERARQAAAQVKPRLAPIIDYLNGSSEPGLRFVGELASRLDLEGLAGKGGVEQVVLYGRGLLPVVRIKLPDASGARRAIDEAAAKSGVTLVDRGNGMRSVAAGEVGEVVFGVRLAERELAIGFAPRGEARELAEHLAGRRPPKRPFVPTYVDLEGAARYGFGHVDSGQLLSAIAGRVPALSVGACPRELAALASYVPRLTLLTDEVSESRVRLRALLELSPGVAARLADLRVAAAGMALPVGDGIATLGFALNLAAGVTVLADAAAAFAAMRHTCPPLRELDGEANELRRALAGPAVLGPYQEVLGFALMIGGFEPSNSTGYILLTASDPFQLFDMAKSFIPGLANLQLRGDGVPVVIPAGTLFLPTEGYLAVRGQTLGVGIGKGTDRTLQAAMAAPTARDRPVFSFAADLPKLEKLLAMLGSFLGGGANDVFGGPSMYRAFEMKVYFDERGVLFTGAASL